MGKQQEKEEAIDIQELEIDESKLEGELNYRWSLIVQMAAAGLPTSYIAKQVRLKERTVDNVLMKPVIKKRIRNAQERFWGKGIRKRMESLAAKALDTIEALLDDPGAKCSTKLAASTYIVDQAVGKAQQNVAIAHTSLGEIMERIDKMSIRDVASLNQLEAPKDALDTCIDEFIPDAVRVGMKEQIVEAETGSVSDGTIEACSKSESDTEV
jgi:hypothetical protein